MGIFLLGQAGKSHMFHDETLPSFFRRLAWSPDGSFLLVPAGILFYDIISQVVIYKNLLLVIFWNFQDFADVSTFQVSVGTLQHLKLLIQPIYCLGVISPSISSYSSVIILCAFFLFLFLFC